MNLESKFIGSIVGVAIGDSIGTLGRWITYFEPSSIPLSYTDDTEMTIGVAESLIQSKGFDPDNMMQRFIANYDPRRGYGPGPPHIFKLVIRGVHWRDAASQLFGGEGSFGNGAAMRVAPIGLLYHNDPSKLREIAYASSELTHTHLLGKEGAALQAYAVALAVKLDPNELDRDWFIDELLSFTSVDVYEQKLRKMKQMHGCSRREVARELGNGIEAHNSVPTAIFSFLENPLSFEKAVAYAIGIGGDTDTIGAMTGAISGAFLGVESIPRRYVENVENSSYLIKLGRKLYRLFTEVASGGSSP